MATAIAEQQLSLDVGGEVGEYIVGEFSLSGKIESRTQELEREEIVYVRICDAAGELLMSGEGWVKEVAFETVPASTAAPKHTIRKHKIKLEPRP